MQLVWVMIALIVLLLALGVIAQLGFALPGLGLLELVVIL